MNARASQTSRAGLASLLVGLACAGLGASPFLPGCAESVDPEAPSADDECPDDLSFFRARIWEPMLSITCIGCHNPNGTANFTSLVLVPPDEEGFLETNFETFQEVARLKEGEIPVLLLRPTGLHAAGHTGGKLIEPDSTAYRDLEHFVRRANGEADCEAEQQALVCDAAPPGRRVLRRLTHDEYDRSVQDLLGVDAALGEEFAPDVVVKGFDNNADALTISPLLADQLRDAAERIASQAMSSNDSIVPCTPTGADDAECARAFIERFGKQMFRRPLTPDEVDRYQTLHVVAAENGFDAGVELVITAMLQSPHFLYRTELGEAGADGLYHLTQYEIATELSFLIWGTTPDQALLAAADSGALATPEQIAAEARRLLADPRSAPKMADFVMQWLGIDRVDTVVKGAAAYPDFDTSIRSAMKDEAAALYDHVRRAGSGALPELLSADYSLPSEALAAFYGEPSAAGPTTFSHGEQAGVLSLGAVLSTYAFADHTSPIHRGKLVRERLLCQDLAPPPANLMVQPVPFDPTLPSREQFAAHASQEPCRSCHRLIDPIGFAFERFDAVGRFRTGDGAGAIDAAGEIVNTPQTDGTFDGVAELGARLAASPDVYRCFVTQWYRYAYAQPDDEGASCSIDRLTQAFERDKLGLDALIVHLTTATHFTTRRADSTGAAPPSFVEPSEQADAGGAMIATDGGSDPPLPDGDVTFDVVTDNSWPMGSCHTVTVTNAGDSVQRWQVTVPVAGTLSDSWNSVVVGDDGMQVTFSGAPHNASLAANESTSFGFCVAF